MSPPSVADLLRAAAVMKRATELSSLHVLRLPGAILSPAVSYYGIFSSPLLPSAPILENDSLHSFVRMWIEAVHLPSGGISAAACKLMTVERKGRKESALIYRPLISFLFSSSYSALPRLGTLLRRRLH